MIPDAMPEAVVCPIATGNRNPPTMPLTIMPAYTRSFRSSLASMLPTPGLARLYTDSIRCVARVRDSPGGNGIGFFLAQVQNTKNRKAPEDAELHNDLDPLILDLLEWIGREPRSYSDVIDAWRTSCPRLTVWEDAIDRGFAMREHAPAGGVTIALTDSGREFLRERGRLFMTVPRAAAHPLP
jgi:hypothetical protein